MLINKIIISLVLFKSVCSFSMDDNLTAHEKIGARLHSALSSGILNEVFEYYEDHCRYNRLPCQTKQSEIRKDLIYSAVLYGYLSLLKHLNLSKNEINNNELEGIRGSGRSHKRLIIIASECRHWDIVQYLLINGADVYQDEVSGWPQEIKAWVCSKHSKMVT